MVPLTAPLFGVLFLQGHISLKNWTYCPILRESATPYKRTCLLIRLTGKRSPGCIVWGAPTALRGGPYSINADNSLRGANSG
jgi:hypothetical protein